MLREVKKREAILAVISENTDKKLTANMHLWSGIIMPELPEVETIKKGLQLHLQNRKIRDVIIRQPKLRWPIDSKIQQNLQNQAIQAIDRRGKYLLINLLNGTLIIHLGMSGSLRVVKKMHPVTLHDHIDFILDNNFVLRFHDPRRFGAVLWTNKALNQHPLFAHLGPEPLSAALTGTYLFNLAKKKKLAIKTFLMDSHIVTGIGNIYATEILFLTKISPLKAVNTLSLEQFDSLSYGIKKILHEAIAKGGTTLKDFSNSDGKPGYFQQTLKAYGRGELPCYDCGRPLVSIKQNQRTTTFCTECQQ